MTSRQSNFARLIACLSTPRNNLPHQGGFWEKYLDWTTIRASLVEGAAHAAQYGLIWDENARVEQSPFTWEHYRFRTADTPVMAYRRSRTDEALARQPF